MRTGPAYDKVTLVERTLVLCKPDAVARGLVGQVIQRLEDALLTMVGIKMVWPTPELIGRHYHDVTERHNVAAYEATVQFMCSGPVVALVLEAVGGGGQGAVHDRFHLAASCSARNDPGRLRPPTSRITPHGGQPGARLRDNRGSVHRDRVMVRP